MRTRAAHLPTSVGADFCLAGLGPSPARRHRFIVLLAAMLASIPAVGPAAAADGASARDKPVRSLTRSFSPNAVTISTSEGTVYGSCNFWTNTPSQCVKGSDIGFGPATVLHINICLSGEVSVIDCSKQPQVKGPLSAALLAGFEQRLSAYAGANVRLVVRFTYNFGPIGPGARDAPLEDILVHIDQLAPILLRHRDLIVALDAGFIGTWGEWHDSTNGNDTAAAQKAVLDRELAIFRRAFPVLVRYPGDLIQYTGGETPEPGLGLHDDAYASNEFDGGTWNPCVGDAGYCLSKTRMDQLKTYAAKVAATTLFTGEADPVEPALQSCHALDQYSQTYHLQFVSMSMALVRRLKTEGCTAFFNKVGVRIELHKLTLTRDPVAEDRLHLAITLSNAGYGHVLRPRPGKMIFLLRGRAVAETPIPLEELDLRKLQPARQPVAITFKIPLRLPAAFRLGVPRAIALAFPDPAPSLESNPAYALALNSIDDQTGAEVFDRTSGYNLIATFNSPRKRTSLSAAITRK
ncbi:MAG: DUF4874 domain-containing protein [Steroidobacteraceae bacterium]